MLKRLKVNDFAIIEDIDISFHNGLTVLTGETGAGKSLIIDCIGLLLGERANLEMIRKGKDKAIITGYFQSKSIYVKSLLDVNGIRQNDDEIVITRVIDESKSVCKINGDPISLTELRKITFFLADIHVQFDMTKLLDKANYINIVDGFRKRQIDEYKEKYISSLISLKKTYQEYQHLLDEHEQLNKKRDEYEYIVKEIESAQLVKDEEDKINERISLLKNYDSIYSLLEESVALINKDGLDDLYDIKENVKKLSTYQKEYEEMYESLNDYYYQIDDLYNSLKNKLHRLDYNPKEYEELENRLAIIEKLKRKYNKDVSSLIEYATSLKEKLNNEDNFTFIIEEKKKEVTNLYNETYQLARDLSQYRHEIKKDMEREVVHHLKDLSLDSQFVVAIKESSSSVDTFDLSIFNENGIDDIEFMIETNVGEGLKTLSKVISGGEASRIMLAMKMIFVKSQNIDTIILDEIDTGISGEAAMKVGRKLYELSLNRQVLAITHLPQVAALANTHIKISKQVKDQRTYTSIKELSFNEKIEEIAYMLSDGKLSQAQIEYAKELVTKREQ